MFSSDEEQIISAMAALLGRVPPPRRAAIASEVLHRVSDAAGRDTPTLPVQKRVAPPKPPEK